MNGSRKLLLTLNAGFAVFSLIWLVGHSTVRVFDWEFWFALAYLTLCAINIAVLKWTK